MTELFLPASLSLKYIFFAKKLHFYRLGLKFRVNETYQVSVRYSVQMKAAMKKKKFCQVYVSIIEYQNKNLTETKHLVEKRLCYSCARSGTFILNLYSLNEGIWRHLYE